MNGAVNFDGDLKFSAIEVKNEIAERVLSLNAESKLVALNLHPQENLWLCHIIPKVSRQFYFLKSQLIEVIQFWLEVSEIPLWRERSVRNEPGESIWSLNPFQVS
jgi:hypothetical protein